MATTTNQEPHEQVIHNGRKILADNEVYQSMVINVKPISAQVKGGIRVTLNEKCLVLDHKEGKVKFEEIASSSLTTTTMVSQSNMMDRTIKFGSFDPITSVPSTRKMVDF
ncbi:hypothetical protein J1N35_018124 [Gossypium stocksii]|uniref:Uncharacterized protein n=1 Tax=Gossypium stocksii TaxID=47602 RepID=A0A9D3VPB2_9ROSI|nr:hypothetical protein J1N35_018124 [Gossypium stocksii]